MSQELPPMRVKYSGHVIQTETHDQCTARPMYCTTIGGSSGDVTDL